LQAAQLNLSQAFAGIGGMAMPQRFALAEWGVLATGAPLCRDALAAFDCDVVEARDVGTHTVFLAKVVATAEAGDGEPLLYQRRAYATARPLCPAEA
jgi:flavin reductase (NADH)/flavin reductase/chlorophenol-4-monooxygenase component 1